MNEPNDKSSWKLIVCVIYPFLDNTPTKNPMARPHLSYLQPWLKAAPDDRRPLHIATPAVSAHNLNPAEIPFLHRHLF